MLERRSLTLGYVPLTDCAPLVVALEDGHFAAEGLDVTLQRQPSWSALRDKLAVGALDAAPMPAGIPLGLSLGLGNLPMPMCVPMVLGLGGNGVTVSRSLFAQMLGHEPRLAADPALAGPALATALTARIRAGAAPAVFGVVFPTATHNYLLRLWLACHGIDPDRDVEIVVVAPPEMAAALASGRVEGFCVGEPWNSLAVAAGLGHLVATGHEIWANAPEKVLTLTAAWADRHPETLQALLRALLRACRSVDGKEQRARLPERLAGHYLDAPASVIAASLRRPDGADMHLFHRNAATFPFLSHAVWLLAQMRRWRQWRHAVDAAAALTLAREVFRCDLYAAAASACGEPLPASAVKREGEHAGPWLLEATPQPIAMGADRFCDGSLFDPADPFAMAAAGASPGLCLSPDAALPVLATGDRPGLLPPSITAA